MGAGANAGGFAAGFGKGLANALLSNRDRADQKKREEQQRQDRLFQAMLPTLIDNVENVADLEPFLAQHLPEQFGGKPGKKGGSPFDNIKRFLGPLIGMKAKQQAEGAGLPPSNQPPGVTGGTLTGPGPVPLGGQGADRFQAPPQAVPPSTLLPPAVDMPPGQDPFGMLAGDHIAAPNFKPAQGNGLPDVAAAPSAQPARRTLLGVPILSADEKLTREIDRRKVLIDKARTSILPALRAVDPTATIEDALSLISTGQMTKDRASATPYQSVAGVDARGNKLYGVFDQSRGIYIDPNTREPIPGFRKDESANVAQFGVDREALARAMYGKGFADLKMEEQQAVIAQEQEMLRKEGSARALGTAQGRFQGPIGVSEAQDTGTQVGASSADYAGQAVAPLDVAERRREMNVLTQELQTLLPTVVDGKVTDPGLLAVLPSKNEAGGVAPGAVLAARRRMNNYREGVARLQSVVDGMATTLARIKAGQRGAQTERDAERAYNAVVQLQAGLLDPFGGDTRESAEARIRETMASIDRVMKGLPTSPVPNQQRQQPGGGATPRPGGQGQPPPGGGTGLKMDEKGNILDSTGKIVIPAA